MVGVWRTFPFPRHPVLTHPACILSMAAQAGVGALLLAKAPGHLASGMSSISCVRASKSSASMRHCFSRVGSTMRRLQWQFRSAPIVDAWRPSCLSAGKVRFSALCHNLVFGCSQALLRRCLLLFGDLQALPLGNLRGLSHCGQTIHVEVPVEIKAEDVRRLLVRDRFFEKIA